MNKYKYIHVVFFFFFRIMVGRKPTVTEKDAVRVIEMYIDHFKTNSFPPYPSSNIWKQMSADLNNKWCARTVYERVIYDYKNYLSQARKNQHITTESPKANTIEYVDETTHEVYSESETYTDGSFHIDEKIKLGLQSHVLPILPDEWDEMKSDGKECNRLKKDVWASVINNIVYKRLALPCAFNAKYSYVNESDENGNFFYLKIYLYCKSKQCNNVLIGPTTNGPNEKGILYLNIETRDTSKTYHPSVHRDLRGEERIKVGKQLQKISAEKYIEGLVGSDVQYGEKLPPNIRKAQVYRQAKSESLKIDSGMDPREKIDVIKSLAFNVPEKSRHQAAIRQIGAMKFYIWYWTFEQIHTYNNYINHVGEDAQISFDATGTVVKQFQLNEFRQTGAIFLYTVTINFENKTIPVCQMLSEIHHTPFILSLLNQWFYDGALVPPQALCDYGQAIAMALCVSCNGFTLKQYIDKCYTWAKSDAATRETTRPATTLIRIDTAHLMALVSRWQCFKTSNIGPGSKGFYMRTIALMIDCQTLQEFEHIFSLTCAVATNIDTTRPVTLPNGGTATISQAMDALTGYMKTREVLFNQLEASVLEYEARANDTPEENFIPGEDGTKTHQRIKELRARVEPPKKKEENTKTSIETFQFTGNVLRLPEFADELERIAKEFPLWTGAAIPTSASKKHASTAYQEGYFASLKRRLFEHIYLPCMPHVFVNEHLKGIFAGTAIIEDKLMHARHRNAHNQNQPDPISLPSSNSYDDLSKTIEPSLSFCNQKGASHNELEPSLSFPYQNDSDLKCKEEWRGKRNESTDSETSEDGDAFVQMVEKKVTDENANFSSLSIGMNISNIDLQNLENCNDFTLPDPLMMYDEEPCTSSTNNNYLEHDQDSHDSNGNFIHIKKNQVNNKYDFNNSVFETTYSIPKNTSSPLLEDLYINKRTSDEQNSFVMQQKKKQKTKSPKLGFYFKKCQNLKVPRNKNKGISIPLLRNGNKIENPLKYTGKRSVKVKNSCPFDAIVHGLMMAMLEHNDYYQHAMTSANSFLKFILSFIEKGSTITSYKNRLKIMDGFYELKSRAPNATSIEPLILDAWDSVSVVWEYFLKGEPSCFREVKCSSFQCQIYEQEIMLLSVNHKMFQKGFDEFQKLKNTISYPPTKTNVQCPKMDCMGIVNETLTFNRHIFIELDIKPNLKTTASLCCRLSNFPVTLEIDQRLYQ